MIQHDHYEELCALAVAGQIAPDDVSDLTQHMETCDLCRERLTDFTQIAAQILPIAADRPGPFRPPAGMTSRFIARARSEGIPLSRPAVKESRGWMEYSAYLTGAALVVGAGVLLLIAVWIWGKYRSGPAVGASSVAPIQIKAPNADALGTNESLQRQIAILRARLEKTEAQAESARQAMQQAGAEKLAAKAYSAELEKTNAELSQQLAARDSVIALLGTNLEANKTQLQRLTAAKSTNEFQIQTAKDELKELRDQVEALASEVNEKQQLSAAAEQAKELIVARKLHIVDVDDTDGNGKQRRPFGRIFYAEGRNLVFYAYDLTDPGKINTKIDFYVWGGREGTNKPAHRLGIFRADDEKDRRWVLKFDDPTVLAQINCVFVTAESNKKPLAQPTGHQILFASLGANANHP